MRFVFASFVLVLGVSVSPTRSVAEEITYAVDLSGIGGRANHILRLAGTIVVDTTTATLVGSNLQFFHDDWEGVQLTSLPNNGNDLKLIASATELRVDPNQGFFPNHQARLSWREAGRSPDGFITDMVASVGNPGFPNQLNFNEQNCPFLSCPHFDFVELGSGVNEGFLIGTVVPEPSSLMLGFFGLVTLTALRKSRRP